MCNERIRREMKAHGVRQWQIAEALGISESLLSKWMRHELDSDTAQNVLAAISRVVKQNAERKIQSAGSRFVVEK